MKTIAVASANEGKVGAVRTAFEKCGADYGWTEYEIVSHASDSGVALTPNSDAMGLQGCENRLASIRESFPSADMYIALEGIVFQLRDKSYIRGWTMIEEVATGRRVSASGASVEVPDFITAQIENDQEFNHLVLDNYPMDDQTRLILRDTGANGAFTKGEYQRSDSFYDGVRICLSLLGNSSNW